MIPVPSAILEHLSSSFGSTAAACAHFGGGREDSDGVVYAYLYQDSRRLLKIMAFPEADQQRSIICLNERLRFMRFLGENEEECLIREMREETGLGVRIERLLLAESPVEAHTLRRTYWCTPISGEAQPGYEPEPEVAARYAIAAVRWLDLRDETTWGEAIISDRYTYPELKAIQAAVGV